MVSTRIDIAERKKVTTVLNAHLADLSDLYSQTKFAHWNVKGPHFIALHELFDKLAETVEGHIDEVAERVTALGGTATGTVRQTTSATRLPEFPTGTVKGLEAVAVLADRFGTVAKTVRAAIDETDGLGDKGTADLLTGVSRDLDQALYFLEAHLSG